MIVFIDSGVLGLLANPNKTGEARDCEQWLYRLLSRGIYTCSSELCDYEIRRNLVLTFQQQRPTGLENLDELREMISFLPITSELLKKAAELWASARIRGIPTADNKSLDIDMIICSHCQLLQEEFPARYVVIATTNVKHLSRFKEAKTWQNIQVI